MIENPASASWRSEATDDARRRAERRREFAEAIGQGVTQRAEDDEPPTPLPAEQRPPAPR